MKASMYFNYTSRSLLRGGQRTLLAIFCVAVGVMAIVALQLVGLMIRNSYNVNARDANGGDIAVTSSSVPLKESDLSYFDQLKRDGKITNYTPIANITSSLTVTVVSTKTFTIRIVDPNSFPVVTPPDFIAPQNGKVLDLLTNDQVIMTQNFADKYAKKVGDSFDVYAKSETGSGETLHVKVVGLVANTGVFARDNNVLLLSARDYQAVSHATPLYDTVDVTTVDQSHTDQAVKDIQNQLPLTNTRTAADALKSQQASIDNISKFLEIAGLLALLIGGVGIVNTMQVLLSRRKTEIAMLKTTGYRRIDLYLLFGLEAGLLGLVGGVVGALAATGVSYLVRALLENVGFAIAFQLNFLTILGGVAIGLVTALIFGLMPIVQAANIRPLNVIRDIPEGRGASSFVLTILLLLILSVLFCFLAIVILNNDVLLGIEAVYGTFIFLLILSVFFGLVVFIISVLPVPERFNFRYLALVLAGIVAAALLYLKLPTFGGILFVLSLMGIVIVLLPRTWKVNTKIALRNIGRQRARTTTTLLALFIGVFTIGLVLILGQDLRDQINSSFANDISYNVAATTSGQDTDTLQAKLHALPGLQSSQRHNLTQTAPVAINGQPLQRALPKGQYRQVVVIFLNSLEGYDLAQKQYPNPNTTSIVQGRNLNADDVGKDNILISSLLTSSGPFQMNLKVGDTITLASVDGKSMRTVTIVGVYQTGGLQVSDHFGTVLAPVDTVKALAPAGRGVTSVFYLKIESGKVNSAVNAISKDVPNANITSLADLSAYIDQFLNSFLSVLIAIASLSLFAGVIIIANAVALAMLERRRELGILKSVGYTSGTVLSEVLIENGVVGGTGAVLAMLLVALAITLLGQFAFHASLGLPPLLIISLIVGCALLAMGTAALVAWGSVRVRPLEVLRYE